MSLALLIVKHLSYMCPLHCDFLLYSWDQNVAISLTVVKGLFVNKSSSSVCRLNLNHLEWGRSLLALP